ncbi:MAG: H-NS histone family protein [Burkholderiales bacterium]|nr:H-NS histone family protein [Burkholderiales bacterium]
MATYNQLQKQIEALQAQASKLKAEEIAGVVARIKEAIGTYGLTPQDLFGGKGVGAASRRVKGTAKGKSAGGAKYADGKGGEWGGRGKRPRWLQEALAAGCMLEEFAVGAVKSAAEALSSGDSSDANAAGVSRRGRGAKKAKAPAKRGSGKVRASVAKFSDGAGNTWSGRGRRPAWYVAALTAGKTPADLTANS